MLPEQAGVFAVANTTCSIWIHIFGEAETQLHKIIEKDIWLKRMTPTNRPFFDLFGSWGLWFWSALQILEIILLIVIIKLSQAHCILSKALNACLQQLTAKQMISLRLECQRGTKNMTDVWIMHLEPWTVNVPKSKQKDPITPQISRAAEQ